ncbi:MAG: hypothetical protein AB1426_11540 [Bacillota bacterium]
MKESLKFELLDIDLVSINAYRTKEEAEEGAKVEMARQTDINVLEIRGDIVKVGLSEKIFFKPAGPFKIDLELEGKFRVDGTPDADKVSAQIEGAMYPLFAKASHIVSFVSNEMWGTPLIIPPFREEE